MSVAHKLEEKVRTEDVMITEAVDFPGLLLSKPVLKGLADGGFQRPSPIQLKAIPLGRCGLDLIVQAKSGTGKTCVFTVIALESVIISSLCVQVLVLAPTREIAQQIQEVIKVVGGAMPGLKCHTFIGGLPVLQDKILGKSCHIAVGTPGRVKQLLEIGALKANSIRLFVLDEADKLLEENFQGTINWIYSALPENKQMLALSATYPEYLAQHLTAYMRNPTFVRLNATDPALLGIKQYHIVVPHHPMPNVVFNSKIETVVKIISSITFQQCLIFSNMQTRAQDLQSELQARNWPTACIAGCLEQKERTHAMQQLKTYKCRILISTDLTSRGIDADKVNLVINLDVPPDHETYLHRIGRAGRFGSFGACVTIVSQGMQEKDLWRIEKRCKTCIHKLPDPPPKDLVSKPVPVRLDDMVSAEQIITRPEPGNANGTSDPSQGASQLDTDLNTMSSTSEELPGILQCMQDTSSGSTTSELADTTQQSEISNSASSAVITGTEMSKLSHDTQSINSKALETKTLQHESTGFGISSSECLDTSQVSNTHDVKTTTNNEAKSEVSNAVNLESMCTGTNGTYPLLKGSANELSKDNPSHTADKEESVSASIENNYKQKKVTKKDIGTSEINGGIIKESVEADSDKDLSDKPVCSKKIEQCEKVMIVKDDQENLHERIDSQRVNNQDHLLVDEPSTAGADLVDEDFADVTSKKVNQYLKETVNGKSEDHSQDKDSIVQSCEGVSVAQDSGLKSLDYSVTPTSTNRKVNTRLSQDAEAKRQIEASNEECRKLDNMHDEMLCKRKLRKKAAKELASKANTDTTREVQVKDTAETKSLDEKVTAGGVSTSKCDFDKQGAVKDHLQNNVSIVDNETEHVEGKVVCTKDKKLCDVDKSDAHSLEDERLKEIGQGDGSAKQVPYLPFDFPQECLQSSIDNQEICLDEADLDVNRSHNEGEERNPDQSMKDRSVDQQPISDGENPVTPTVIQPTVLHPVDADVLKGLSVNSSIRKAWTNFASSLAKTAVEDAVNTVVKCQRQNGDVTGEEEQMEGKKESRDVENAEEPDTKSGGEQNAFVNYAHELADSTMAGAFQKQTTSEKNKACNANASELILYKCTEEKEGTTKLETISQEAEDVSKKDAEHQSPLPSNIDEKYESIPDSLLMSDHVSENQNIEVNVGGGDRLHSLALSEATETTANISQVKTTEVNNEKPETLVSHENCNKDGQEVKSLSSNLGPSRPRNRNKKRSFALTYFMERVNWDNKSLNSTTPENKSVTSVDQSEFATEKAGTKEENSLENRGTSKNSMVELNDNLGEVFFKCSGLNSLSSSGSEIDSATKMFNDREVQQTKLEQQNSFLGDNEKSTGLIHKPKPSGLLSMVTAMHDFKCRSSFTDLQRGYESSNKSVERSLSSQVGDGLKACISEDSQELQQYVSQAGNHLQYFKKLFVQKQKVAEEKRHLQENKSASVKEKQSGFKTLEAKRSDRNKTKPLREVETPDKTLKEVSGVKEVHVEGESKDVSDNESVSQSNGEEHEGAKSTVEVPVVWKILDESSGDKASTEEENTDVVRQSDAAVSASTLNKGDSRLDKDDCPTGESKPMKEANKRIVEARRQIEASNEECRKLDNMHDEMLRKRKLRKKAARELASKANTETTAGVQVKEKQPIGSYLEVRSEKTTQRFEKQVVPHSVPDETEPTVVKDSELNVAVLKQAEKKIQGGADKETTLQSYKNIKNDSYNYLLPQTKKNGVESAEYYNNSQVPHKTLSNNARAPAARLVSDEKFPSPQENRIPRKPSKTEARLAGLEVSDGATSSSDSLYEDELDDEGNGKHKSSDNSNDVTDQELYSGSESDEYDDQPSSEVYHHHHHHSTHPLYQPFDQQYQPYYQSYPQYTYPQAYPTHTQDQYHYSNNWHPSVYGHHQAHHTSNGLASTPFPQLPGYNTHPYHHHYQQYYHHHHLPPPPYPQGHSVWPQLSASIERDRYEYCQLVYRMQAKYVKHMTRQWIKMTKRSN